MYGPQALAVRRLSRPRVAPPAVSAPVAFGDTVRISSHGFAFTLDFLKGRRTQPAPPCCRRLRVADLWRDPMQFRFRADVSAGLGELIKKGKANDGFGDAENLKSFRCKEERFSLLGI
jgi:hypothetical protein